MGALACLYKAFELVGWVATCARIGFGQADNTIPAMNGNANVRARQIETRDFQFPC